MSNQKWVPIVSRRITVLRTFLTARGCRDEIARYLGHGCDYLTITKNELSSVYLAAKDTKRVSELVLEKIKENPNFPQQHSRDCREACSSLVQVSQICQKFDRYCEEYTRFAKFMGIPVAIERMLTAQIEQVVGDSMAKLMTSPELSEFQKEQLDLLRLAIDGGSIQDHADTYRWLSCYNIDEPAYEDSYFLGRLEELKKQSKEVLQRQLQELEEQHRQDQIVYQTILDGLQLDEHTRKQIELLREYVFLRTHRIEAQTKSNYYIQSLFQALSHKLNLSLRQITALSPEEIEQAIIDRSTIPSMELLETRCREYVFRYDDHGIALVIGKEAIELEREELGIQDEKMVSELRGTVAYRGEPIQARVQIVLTKDDIRNFETGRILVTTMTTPEFVSIMNKASAIVTNEGGVLCHAAIVARELKKPCIIGTKIATQILRNGDEVEVDAEKGIVKVLKTTSQ
ncbi:hypothetical protein FJZ48_00900 [Candidatus Uhrbacteria bacterium]|nr:hypothetical protein [Candidatus Uhrbacteria bacterium]